jgi:hypothetical protein
MICRLRGWWETLTMDAFWRSLVQPPLVVVSGHVWPVETKWSKPRLSPLPEDWPDMLMVEFDDSACVRCGYVPEPRPWRRSYAVGVIS